MVKNKLYFIKSGITLKSAMSRAAEVKSGKAIIRRCASLLRQEVLTIESTPLQSNMSANDIMAGEVEIPENRKYFYRKLFTGEDEAGSRKLLQMQEKKY